MLFMGGAWRKLSAERLEVEWRMSLVHAHCSTCISARCERSYWLSPDGCPVEICPNGCGTYLHLCKLDEHTRHTCWAALVPCVNASSGCEMVLPKAKRAQHLQHCPASILLCRFTCEKKDVDAALGKGQGDKTMTPGHHVDERVKFCYPCREIVRRDEFPVNCKDVHVCTLSLPVHPVKEVHVQEDSSEKTRQDSALYGYGNESDVLGQLPVEILTKICQGLDSLTLWNLSQMNRHIRSVCFNLAKKKGIVYYVWQKNMVTKKWEQGPKVLACVLYIVPVRNLMSLNIFPLAALVIL